MKRRRVYYIALGPGLVYWALLGGITSFCPSELGSEDLTLSTYYPAPLGVYSLLTTTGNTTLGRDGGNVQIGQGSAIDVDMGIIPPMITFNQSVTFTQPININQMLTLAGSTPWLGLRRNLVLAGDRAGIQIGDAPGLHHWGILKHAGSSLDFTVLNSATGVSVTALRLNADGSQENPSGASMHICQWMNYPMGSTACPANSNAFALNPTGDAFAVCGPGLPAVRQCTWIFRSGRMLCCRIGV